MYHFLGTEADARQEKNYVSERSFARQMAFLKRFGYRVISMKDYDEIRSGRRPARGRELVITFDDGHHTFPRAFKELQKRGFPVTLFLISESVKRGLGGSMRARKIHRLLGSGLITLGSHSRTHPSLPSMTEEQMREEMAGSKQDLEEMFGRPVDYIAYPLGDVDGRVVKMARETGYRLGFSTSHKHLQDVAPGPYAMTRPKISRNADNPFVFWAKISGLYGSFKTVREKIKKRV
jgi:peptidoglycan/xylan/chitin deacetylase (PgdA/CDA1 family)